MWGFEKSKRSIPHNHSIRIIAAHGKGTDGIFDQVVVRAKTAVLNIADHSLNIYKKIVDEWALYDNSGSYPELQVKGKKLW